MVRKCSVVGCRGNYDKRKGSSDYNKVSVFRFPKDAERLRKWLKKIPQANLKAENITDNMGVCEKHFDPRFFSVQTGWNENLAMQHADFDS